MKPFSCVRAGDCLTEQQEDADKCQVIHASASGDMGDHVEAISILKQKIVIPTGGKVLLCTSQNRPDIYIHILHPYLKLIQTSVSP